MQQQEIKRSDFKCWVKIGVRWGDMDALGHVNNAKYFTYCESARIKYFEQIEIGSFIAHSQGPTLANASLNFKQQVRYPAALEVGSRVSEIKNRSFRMDYAIFYEGTEQIVAEGSSVVVWADYKAGKSADLPQTIRNYIERFEERSF